MSLLCATSLDVPFLAVANPRVPDKLGGKIHLFVAHAWCEPPRRREARMSLCNRFAASQEAFETGTLVQRFEKNEDTCPRCWGVLKSTLIRRASRVAVD